MKTKGNFNVTYYKNVGADLIDKETVTDTIHFDTYGRGELTASGDVDISITGLKANKSYSFLLYNSGGHSVTFSDSFLYTSDGNADFTLAGDYLLTIYCFEDTSGSEIAMLFATDIVEPATTTTTTA